MKKIVLLFSSFVFTTFFFSCSKTNSSETHTALFAHLTSEQKEARQPEDVFIHAVIRNYSNADTIVNTISYENTVLAVTVVNEKGIKLHSIPPSTPPSDLRPYKHLLHPGDSLVYEHRLNIFGMEFPPGKYAAYMSCVPSDSIWFELK